MSLMMLYITRQVNLVAWEIIKVLIKRNAVGEEITIGKLIWCH
jgi:hypothetical protein